MWCTLCCRSGARPSGVPASGGHSGGEHAAGLGTDPCPAPQAGERLPFLALPRTRCLPRGRVLPPCLSCRHAHPRLLCGHPGAVLGRGCCPQVRGRPGWGGALPASSSFWGGRGWAQGSCGEGVAFLAWGGGGVWLQQGQAGVAVPWRAGPGVHGSGCLLLSAAPCLRQLKTHSTARGRSQEQLPRRGRGKSSE